KSMRETRTPLRPQSQSHTHSRWLCLSRFLESRLAFSFPNRWPDRSNGEGMIQIPFLGLCLPPAQIPFKGAARPDLCGESGAATIRASRGLITAPVPVAFYFPKGLQASAR